MEQIKDIIPQVIGQLSCRTSEVHAKIQKYWRDVVPNKSRGHTMIQGFSKGKLLIQVDSSAWLFQLNMQKKQILEKIQKEIPEILEIILKIGKVR